MSEVVENFCGSCRGRTYGPLIKSGRRPMIQTARSCEGSPFIVENDGRAGFLLIPLLLPNSVVCEDF